jgi:hypothetical protein
MIPRPPCRDFHNVEIEASRWDRKGPMHELLPLKLPSGVRLASYSGLPRG